ncbi:hypothetical protein K501DRAFT_332972 [Backusella circina FSU 941]|nr:hypothetical protein K501DRAFT_332972 [Backusella circina FSU 941]
MSDASDDEIPLKQKLNKPGQKIMIPKVEDSSDEDIPLSMITKQKKPLKPSTTSKPAKPNKRVKNDSDSEDDVPLAFKAKQKKAIKAEPMDIDIKQQGTKRPRKSKDDVKTVKKEQLPDKKRAKTADGDEEVYKWWEEENTNANEQLLEQDGSVKWSTLQHSGVLFPPSYVSHGIKMRYNGKLIKLSPEAEEVASFFAALLETDHGKNPTFQKNFFRDWQEVLKQDPNNPEITDFDKCDFKPMWEKFEADKEKKKQLTKDEKLKIKEEKQQLEEPFLTCLVDGRKEKVGNFRIEPPGLFRGRGDHPKTGSLKKRVLPEQITLNLGVDAKIPKPPKGHRWASVVHDQTATWLATWKENVNGSTKYVFLAATSAWKGQSDMQKFEKARNLKNFVGKIRETYNRELKDKLSEVRQRATAMYLIDQLALRAGNEKGDDEADTVGCCSLRWEHITLEPPNILNFDFLGKDSIRYQNSVEVLPQVYKNIGIFKKQVGKGNMIFDRLTPSSLNKYLNSCMPGLSAKVFRTYNASHTFQQQLDAMDLSNESIPDKLLAFNRANREVAVLCNHQKSASKNHSQQMEKITDKIRALKYQRMKIRKQLLQLEPNKYKKNLDFNADESDLEEDWIVEHEASLIEKEKERSKTKFEKNNEKLIAEGKAPLPMTDLTEKIKSIDEVAKRLKKERKTGKVEPKSNMTEEKALTQIGKIDERISATRIQATDKEENKEIALGTSKMNYIDPRITIVWCKNNEVPLEKVFSKTLIEKFRWAQNTPEDWKF